MSSILQSLLTFVLLYKYAAIFVLTFLASIAFPIPSGAMASAAFFFATQGYMSAPLIALTSVAGNIAGDLLTFWFVRRYGVGLVQKIGFGRVLEAAAVKNIEAKIVKHPVITVFVSRITTSVTPLVNVVVGFSKMPFRIFAIAAIVGEIAEVGVNYVYGTFFGNEIVYVSQVVGLSGILLLALAGLVIVLVWKRSPGSKHTHPKPL